jgi:hypothetical protein
MFANVLTMPIAQTETHATAAFVSQLRPVSSTKTAPIKAFKRLVLTANVFLLSAPPT